MITFETDDVLTGDKPHGLPAAQWEAARDVAELHLHEEYCTFFVPENAEDLSIGGMISALACDGMSVAAAIGTRIPVASATVFAATINVTAYYADVLLLMLDADWIPADVRQSIAQKSREGDDDA